MKKFLFVGLAIIFFAILLIFFLNRGIVLVIINESNAQVEKISVKYNGGSIELHTLSPKSSEKVPIIPQGETDLTLEYVNPFTKEVQSERIDIYLEPNYIATVEIRFKADGKINWQEDISWWVNPFR